jgi:hypothetical protein
LTRKGRENGNFLSGNQETREAWLLLIFIVSAKSADGAAPYPYCPWFVPILPDWRAIYLIPNIHDKITTTRDLDGTISAKS